MKKILLLIIVGFVIYGVVERNSNIFRGTQASDNSENQIFTELYKNNASDTQVHGSGTVIRTLPDDNEGSRHQKFILELSSGQTLLISHNIDIAPRIDQLRQGDSIEFYGEYEWNNRGGVVHWTHHDPRGIHENGWLKHHGITYK